MEEIRQERWVMGFMGEGLVYSLVQNASEIAPISK